VSTLRRRCPVCGSVATVTAKGKLRGHVNPSNPPLPFARWPCPGPTPEQRAYALEKDRKYHEMARECS
jgi:hypothetical protein